MAERLARSLVVLRRQINEARTGRDKTSDGWIGDKAHRNQKSDHNPNKYGVVQAIDIDNDLSAGETAANLVRAIQMSGDPRIKYLIYNGKITVKNNVRTWKVYTGINAHKQHFHLSVVNDRGLYDDETEWDLSRWEQKTPDAVTETPPGPVQPELQRGDKGPAVKRLQEALRAHGEMIDADGDFGPATERAVKNFQLSRGLRPDGIAGKNTNASLRL